MLRIAPVEASMYLGAPTNTGDTTPMPPWRSNTTVINAIVAMGRTLQINVDASDPNEEDDVDVYAVGALPAGAACELCVYV